MSHSAILKITGISALSFLVIACGQAESEAPAENGLNVGSEVAHATEGNHEDHDMAAVNGGDTDHAAGKVIELDLDGRRIKIDHEELPNIGMNAMTMFFGIAGDVDLSMFEAGDDVRFMVKRGRDGSYRIMTMCDVASEGTECLATLMADDAH